MAKLLKDIKKNPEPSVGKNIDPGQLGQYSAKYNINETGDVLDQYLSAKGIESKYLSKDTKISHSKSNDFIKWKRDRMKEDVTTNHREAPGQDHKTDLSVSPTKKRLVTLRKAKSHYEIPSPPGTMRKEETITELKKSTVSSYMQKAKQQSKEAEPHTKGEYGSIAQRLIDRRKKGMAMGAKKEGNQMSSLTPEDVQIEEVGPEDHKSQHNPWKQKHFGPHTVVSNRKMSDQEKVDWEKHKKWKQDVDNALASDMKRIKKEEVEVNEVSSELLGRYKDKAKKSADALTAAGKHKQSTDRWMNVMKATGKQIDKTTAATKKALNKEDVGNAKAAVNADGLSNPQLEPVSERKKQISKSANIIKSIYKKHKMVKEELYDHEKEDKSVATYGKKPKFDKAEKDEGGEKKPSAAATMTGGTTLTGSPRDDIEIDPMMRNRPGQPDVTKKDDKKKDDKKKEEKK